ncbi:MAG: hypothetical protein ACD_69C00356G0003 [uncultured bacterium]|nr:MAG: hypothetical protein ACD_69C00356G0003 [uncultured bacterium]
MIYGVWDFCGDELRIVTLCTPKVVGAPCYKYKKIKQLQNKQALRSQVLYPTDPV